MEGVSRKEGAIATPRRTTPSIERDRKDTIPRGAESRPPEPKARWKITVRQANGQGKTGSPGYSHLNLEAQTQMCICPISARGFFLPFSLQFWPNPPRCSRLWRETQAAWDYMFFCFKWSRSGASIKKKEVHSDQERPLRHANESCPRHHSGQLYLTPVCVLLLGAPSGCIYPQAIQRAQPHESSSSWGLMFLQG